MKDLMPTEETKEQEARHRGRPKKGSSLTDFLHKVFDEKREIDGREINTKELMAEYVRGAITKGEVELITGTVYVFTPESWLDLVKWAYNRMDGNPVTPIDQDGTTHLVFDNTPTVETDYLPSEYPRIEVVDEVE